MSNSALLHQTELLSHTYNMLYGLTIVAGLWLGAVAVTMLLNGAWVGGLLRIAAIAAAYVTGQFPAEDVLAYGGITATAAGVGLKVGMTMANIFGSPMLALGITLSAGGYGLMLAHEWATYLRRARALDNYELYLEKAQKAGIEAPVTPPLSEEDVADFRKANFSQELAHGSRTYGGTIDTELAQYSGYSRWVFSAKILPKRLEQLRERDEDTRSSIRL